MKKNIIYISAAAFALLFSACERVEEIEAPVSGQMEEMRFVASIESGADTKTMIDGNVGDETRHLKWLPEDAIGVYNNSSRKFEKFVNVNSETSASGVFEGANTVQDVYYAVYPYSESHSYADRDKIMTVDLPAVQNYAENTFGNGANPMVAHAESGEELMFQNLCGVLVINLTGSVTVKSMSVTLLDESGNLAPVSGRHTVSMDYIEEPSLNSTEESTRSVTLDCGEGVALNSAEPTPFHIVVPAGTYNGITLSVVTADGQMMVKHGQNQLKIRRRRVTSAGALGWETVVAVDLSERGTSNCYIVSESGAYSFDATTIGNGEFGLIPDAGFHTDDVNIAPSTVELLWEDRSGVVQSVFCKDGRISFYSSGMEGNALLAAKDASGTIIWSWHIWVTDKPVEQKYENTAGTFDVLDRNLGATRADRGVGDEWLDSRGLAYFWGRKDPFWYGSFTNADGWLTIETSIENPTMTHRTGGWTGDRSSWAGSHNPYLWMDEQKTIYDPCPVGYKVPVNDIWVGFTSTGGFSSESSEFCVKDNFNNGWEFYIDKTQTTTTWYPANYWIDWSGGRYEEYDNKGAAWASDFRNGSNKYALTYQDDRVSPDDMISDGHGLPVRCMKDEEYIDISHPRVEFMRVENLTSKSARIVCRLKSEGVSEVTERGVIYGLENDLSDGVKAVSDDNSEEFSVELNLSHGTRYYIKPYAINGRGESQGTEVTYFITPSTDSEVSLNQNGTANCYIVSPVPSGVYSFDCSVQGNSGDSVGTVASLEVLWEVDGCSATAQQGEVISSVELKNGVLGVINLPSVAIEGNALIAAKDKDGTILWSWHIWVTDTPAEQTYVNDSGTFVVLDRNIGATRADRGTGDEWKDSRGLAYSWGRKDPFWYEKYTVAEGYITLEYSIANPCERHKSNGWGMNSSWLGDYNHIPTLWEEHKKTQYDPCPVGYRVVCSDAWDGFTSVRTDTEGGYDYGWNFYINESETAWYPASYVMGNFGNYEIHESRGCVWASDESQSYDKHCLSFSDTAILRNGGASTVLADGDGFPVRCMKE